MADSVQLKKLSPTHHAIMNYLVANPCVPLSIVAKEFGITQPWLSVVLNSDIFRDMMGKRQDAVFHHTVMPLKEKMTVLASKGLDKLIDKMDVELDMDVARKTTEGVLDRLGFGTGKNGPINLQINNTQNVHLTQLREEVEEAKRHYGMVAKPVLDVEIDNEVRSTPQIRQEGFPSVGQDDTESAFSDLEAIVKGL